MFIIELQPAALVYLTKLMDAPSVTVKSEDVMTHAQIRQQLAQPSEGSKLVAQWKAEGAQEAARTAPPTGGPAPDAAPIEQLRPKSKQ